MSISYYNKEIFIYLVRVVSLDGNIEKSIRFDTVEDATKISDGIWQRKTVLSGIDCFLVSDKLLPVQLTL